MRRTLLAVAAAAVVALLGACRNPAADPQTAASPTPAQSVVSSASPGASTAPSCPMVTLMKGAHPTKKCAQVVVRATAPTSDSVKDRVTVQVSTDGVTWRDWGSGAENAILMELSYDKSWVVNWTAGPRIVACYVEKSAPDTCVPVEQSTRMDIRHKSGDVVVDKYLLIYY